MDRPPLCGVYGGLGQHDVPVDLAAGEPDGSACLTVGRLHRALHLVAGAVQVLLTRRGWGRWRRRLHHVGAMQDKTAVHMGVVRDKGGHAYSGQVERADARAGQDELSTENAAGQVQVVFEAKVGQVERSAYVGIANANGFDFGRFLSPVGNQEISNSLRRK